MNLDDMVVRSHPGQGVVGRFPAVAIVLAPTGPEHDAALGQLLDLAEAASATGPTPGRRLARQVAGLLSSADPDDVPAFGLLAQADTGVVLILQGAMDADVSSPDGGEHLSGGSVATWVDRILPATVASVVVTPTGTRSLPDPRTRLGSGVVSGAGLSVIAPATAAPAAPPPPATPALVEEVAPVAPLPPPPPPMVEPVVAVAPAQDSGAAGWPPPDAESQLPPPAAPSPVPAPEVPASPEILAPTVAAEAAPTPLPGAAQADLPEAPRPFIAVALADPDPEPVEVREPLPIAGEAPGLEEPSGPRVRGVICSRGHFNDPAAPFCGACGISMVQRTLNLVEGPRPPLGIIVFDDGTTFTLDTDYVLGREPENDPQVRSGAARPLAMEDPDRTVSRVHAGLVIDGWSVTAVDRGSANGTFVAGPGDDNWVALIPNQPFAIKPGTRVRLGQRVFLYDSHQGTR